MRNHRARQNVGHHSKGVWKADQLEPRKNQSVSTIHLTRHINTPLQKLPIDLTAYL